jgi:hypothetical protein
MPRYIFEPEALALTGRPQPVTFFLTFEGRNRVTDLWTIDDDDNLVDPIINGVLIADASTGLVGPFAGPDDYNVLWLQAGTNVEGRESITAVRSSESQPDPGGGEEGEVPPTRTIATGAGLSGGGTLAADRTIEINFGTGVNQVPRGNDSRLSDARTPTAHASSHATGGSDPMVIPQSQVTNLVSTLAAKADLVGGKVPTSQLPALSSGATYVVSTQAAMLALLAGIGDICIRPDLDKSYVLAAMPPSTLSNWVELLATDIVQSVNGQIGIVSLTAANVGAAATSHAHSASDVTSGTLSTSRLPTIPVSLAPAGTNITVDKSGGTWPARPTSRTDIIVRWRGADPSPAIVASGTSGMIDGVDIREIPAT